MVINILFPELLEFDANESDFDGLRYCFEFKKLHFTRLDSEKHDMFFPNVSNSESINRVCQNNLSVRRLKDVFVTNYSIFIDILNFNEDLCPGKKQRVDNLPTILFSTNDRVDRIDVLYKKSPYKLIKNVIGNYSIDEDVIAIENKLRLGIKLVRKGF